MILLGDGRSCRLESPALRGDGGGERSDVVGAVVALPVDKERRCAGHAAEISGLDVLGDTADVGAMFEVVAEPGRVELELLGVADEISPRQHVLVLQEQVVHRPEGTLSARRFCGFGRQLRLGVDVGQWQVTPYVADGGVGEQLADDGLGQAAVRAFEVTEFDDRDGGVPGTPEVVPVGVDCGDEILDQAGIAEQRPGPLGGGQEGRDPEHGGGKQGGQHGGGQGAEFGLVELCPLEGTGGDQEGHGEADPGMVPLAVTAAFPIGGRMRPWLKRVTAHELSTTPTGLPAT